MTPYQLGRSHATVRIFELILHVPNEITDGERHFLRYLHKCAQVNNGVIGIDT